MLLEGLHIPLTTPFHSDGRLALHKLASNVERYSKTPAAGLIVLGPSGEPTLLTDDETREVLRTAAQSAAPEKVLIAGISRDSVRSTLILANFAAEQAYDAVLLIAPEITATNTERITYFETIADSSPLPILLLSTTVQPIGSDAIAQLARHPQIIGLATSEPAIDIAAILAPTSAVRRDVKVTPTFSAVTQRMETVANSNRNSAMLISATSLTSAVTALAEPPAIAPPLRTRSKSVGFQIISGNSGSLHDALNAGATGIAPAFAAAAPQACFEVFAAWKDGDTALAEEKQARIIAAAQLAEASPAALKFACDLNGYYGGPARLPHLPLTAAQRDELEELMKPLRN
jgi:4-hydroxy-2-oxoglutarate aldolase